MYFIQNIAEMQNLAQQWRNEGLGIGFVPTMGALHAGHVSLMERAKENERRVVSVFVNPRQFGANEDFSRYPRMLETDCALCEKQGVDAVFAPNAKELYAFADGVQIVAPKPMSSVLEGAARPGHFDGVLDVLARLFHIVQPHKAYFGRKDAQQLLIVRQMVAELFWGIEIVGCPIVRDFKGLALSSRNAYLSEQGYYQALQIARATKALEDAIAKGNRDAHSLLASTRAILAPLQVDYLMAVDYMLNEVEILQDNASLIVMAVIVENVRLLDNVWV